MLSLRLKIFLFFALIILFLSFGSYANNQRLLIFNEPNKDIGIVKEKDGLVDISYEFTNVSSENVTILNIYSQCGCLVPSFSTEPIAPGERGVVNVVFDPTDRFSDFKIGLTVIASNGNYKKFNTLVASGVVISRIPEVLIKYPCFFADSVYADIRTIGMRQILAGDKRIRTLKLYNNSNEIRVLFYSNSNKNLTISGPKYINPKQEAIISFVFDSESAEIGLFSIGSVIHVGEKEVPVEVKGAVVDNDNSSS